MPGSGLGLALVRAKAESHNGRVTLRSRPSQGTVFISLHLPAGRTEPVTDRIRRVSKA